MKQSEFSELVSHTLDAITSLFDPKSPPETCTEANSYLTDFNLTEDAWSVYHQILSDSSDNMTVAKFASNVLKEKCKVQWSQLPAKERENLYFTMEDVLVKHCDVDPFSAVQSRALELEFSPEQYSEETKKRFKVAKEFSADIFHFLEDVIDQIPNSETKLLCVIFDCYSHWAIFHGYPTKDMVNSKIITRAFKLLSSGDKSLEKSCTDVAVSSFMALCEDEGEFVEGYEDVVQALIPQCLDLTDLYKKATNEDNVDLQWNIARIIGELCQTNMGWILKGGDLVMDILGFMVELLKANNYVFDSATEFWSPFITELAKFPPKDQRIFDDVILEYVGALMDADRFPCDIDYKDEEAMESSIEFREISIEPQLSEAMLILPSAAIVEIAFNRLKEAESRLENNQDVAEGWTIIESSIHSVCCIQETLNNNMLIDAVNESEESKNETKKLLPDFVQYLFSNDVVGRHELIFARFIELLGLAHSLYSESPESLKSVLEMLRDIFADMDTYPSQLVEAAAHTYLEIGTNCSPIVVMDEEWVSAYGDVYQRSLKSRDPTIRSDTISGISHLVSEFEHPECTEFLDKVVTQQVEILQEALTREVPKEDIREAMDVIGILFSCCRPSSEFYHKKNVTYPTTAVLMNHYETFEKCFELVGFTDLLSELLGIFKGVFFSADSLAAPICESFFGGLVGLYEERQCKEVLDCIPPMLHHTPSWCGDNSELFIADMEIIINKTLPLLETTKHQIENPGIAGSFFKIFSRVIDDCQMLLLKFKDEDLNVIFNSCAQGLLNDHGPDYHGCMDFLYQFFGKLYDRTDIYKNDEYEEKYSVKKEPILSLVQQIFETLGQEIIDSIVSGLFGYLLPSNVSLGYKLYDSLLLLDRKSVLKWTNDSFMDKNPPDVLVQELDIMVHVLENEKKFSVRRDAFTKLFKAIAEFGFISKRAQERRLLTKFQSECERMLINDTKRFNRFQKIFQNFLYGKTISGDEMEQSMIEMEEIIDDQKLLTDFAAILENRSKRLAALNKNKLEEF